MNAVKISVLLIVFWFLFTAVPCFAAVWYPYGQTPAPSLATVSEDNANRPLGNLELVGNSTQIGNASEPPWATEAVYSIVSNVRNPTVYPGEMVEIEVYASGYGIPAQNKLLIIWSSPYVIDGNDPGYLIFNKIFGLEDLSLKQSGNFTGAYSAWSVLGLGFFAEFNPLTGEYPDIGLKTVVGEFNWGDEPPILIKPKTREDASLGDYQVKFIFTYGYANNPKQDFKVVEFHVTSYWERNQRWYTIGLGVGIPLVIFVAGIILRKRQAKKQKKGKR